MTDYRISERKGRFYIQSLEMKTFLGIPFGRDWFDLDEYGRPCWGAGYPYDNLADARGKAAIYSKPETIHNI